MLNVNGEKDSVGNVSTMTLTIPVYNDSKIVSIESNEDLVDGENITKKYNGNLDSFFFDMDKSYKVNINKTFEGITDFGISMSVNTISSGVNLFKQGEDINLSIDEEGYLNFKVKDLNVSSKEELTTVVEKAHGTFGTDEYVPTSIKTTLAGKINDGRLHQITAVREVNGMIKLYVDGELASSVYDKSKVNQSINSGELEVADDNFRGILGGIEFRNSSIYYDEVKERYDKYNEVPVIEYDRNDWIASACSEMLDSTGDGPASSAIDGNENSWWHTNYIGTDQHSENHWISIDFSKEISFDSIDVLSRGKSSNGTIKQYKLEAKVNGVWEVVKEGEFIDGKTDKIELEDSIKASVIRLTSISTFNGQNFAAIKEIYVSQKDRLATQEEINEVISLVQEIDENNYTKATVNNYKEVASKITSLDVANTQVLNMLKAQLELAYSSLLESKDLNDLITISEMLDKEYYTEESWVKFNDALNNAKVVINNIESTEENVNNAKTELENAINNLVIKEDDTEKVDKTGLGKVVEYAEYAKLNGALEEVVPAVINEFEAALKEAKDVLADDNATEAQVDEATKRLVNVIHMLEFKKGDKAELKKLVQIINTLDQSKYTPATWTSLQATFEEANNVIANENAMEEEVSEAYEKLVKAYLDLRLIADKAKLQELINKSENIDISKYTKESVNKFNLSLANGKSVLAKEEVTQEEVDKAVKELTLALAGLEVKQENSGNNNNDDNNDTSGEKGSNNNLPSTGGSSPMAVGIFATLISIAGIVVTKRKSK